MAGTVLILSRLVTTRIKATRTLEVSGATQNKDAYGPVLKSWTVSLCVSDDGEVVHRLGISGDENNTLACVTAAKKLACQYIATRFAEKVEDLHASARPNGLSVDVFIEHPAWTGPDPDDDFLMKVGP